MSSPRPVYVLAERSVDPAVLGLVPGHEPTPLTSPADLEGRPPGLLLLPVDALAPAALIEALLFAARAPNETPWMPVLIERAPDGAPIACPLSVGWTTPPDELARWASGADDAKVLELRQALARVARGRHDINNPLTSAMAETQLALMDEVPGAIRVGLETIDEQLKRIRDLVAELRVLRPPAEPPRR